MIFVPNEDFSRAGTRTLCKSESGKAFTVTAEMHKTAVHYCAAYDPSMDSKIKKNTTVVLQRYITQTGALKIDLSYHRFDK